MSEGPVLPDEALMQFLYQAPIGLVQATLQGEITMINPRALQLLLPLAPKVEMVDLFALLSPVMPQVRGLVADFSGKSGMICEGRRVQVAQPGTPLDGSHHRSGCALAMSISILKLDADRLLISLHDISAEIRREQEALASELSKAARTDSLTKMPNRVAMLERITELMHRSAHGDGSDFALLVLDCDRFGLINDTHGHAVGDTLLRQVAERLSKATRASDVICGNPDEAAAGRLGSDEFVVLLTGIRSGEDAVAVGRRLFDLLARPYWIGPLQIHLEVSIGLVLPGQIGGDPDSVLQDAFLAVSSGRRSAGRGNRVCVFEQSMRDLASHRGRIEHELRRALSNDELFVVYQPVIDMRDGSVQTMEALVRWQHPERGLVPPDQFIEIAEQVNLIGPLGELVLERACEMLAVWQETLGERAPLSVSVNVSRAQLLDPGIVDAVRRILGKTGLTPSQLKLEITESLAAQDERIQTRLKELKALDLKLALDDFGTGYSSLSSLHLLPVDVIKIDRSFVRLLDESAHHRVLVESTLRVARSLAMHTIAEGVETPSQLQWLKALGCDAVQGYLISRPLTAEQAIDWLTAFEPHRLRVFDGAAPRPEAESAISSALALSVSVSA